MESTKKCPKCGGVNILPIVYGFPAGDMFSGDGVTHHLGGCCIWPGQPELYCKDCEHEFGGKSKMEQKNYKYLLAEELAKTGNKEAMLEVFNYYINHDNGDLLVENIELIFSYLTTLAEDGDGYAMRHLGNLYNKGRGVEQDHNKAIEWYEKAASMSDTYAMCSLGYIYYYGSGAEQNYEKAYRYIALAAYLEPRFINYPANLRKRVL